jgi:hypothetical protein
MYRSKKLNPRTFKPSLHGHYGSAYGGDEELLTLDDVVGNAAQYVHQQGMSAASAIIDWNYYPIELLQAYATQEGKSVEEVKEQVAAEVVDKQPCLAQGVKGPAVSFLVQAIADKYQSLGLEEEDVISAGGEGETFGPAVDKLVRAYQTKVFRSEDGIVGPNTWKKLGWEGAPCPKKQGSGSSSGGTVVTSGSAVEGRSTNITDEVWFWPVLGGVAFVGLVIGVKQLKKRKKKTNRRRRRRHLSY